MTKDKPEPRLIIEAPAEKLAHLQNLRRLLADIPAPPAPSLEDWVEAELGEMFWSKQREVAQAMRDHRRVAVKSCHGVGKALALDTPIPTPSGWTTMGLLRRNATILDERGSPTRVIGVSETFLEDCYRVSFDDGTSIVCSKQHEWEVLPQDLKLGDVATWLGLWNRTTTLTTEGLAADPAARWRIPLSASLEGTAHRSKTRPEFVMRHIVSIERVETVPTRCVEVSSPRHLYLAGKGFIPTHNSFLASRTIAHWLSTHPEGDAFVVSSAPTFAQTRAILWREIGKAHAKGNLPGRVTQTEWQTDAGELIGFGRKPADTDPSAFQGIHAKYVLVVLDEACHDDQTDVLTSEGWKRWSDVSDSDLLLTMNPATHQARYSKPERIVRKRYRGPMVLNEAKGSNWCVTPDHDMYFRGKSRGEYTAWRKGRADYLADADNKYMLKSINWDVEDQDTYTIPELIGKRKTWPALDVDMDDWMTFLGWFFSEGSVPNLKERGARYLVTISQKDPEVLSVIHDLCLRLGLPAKKYEGSVRIHSRQIAELLHGYGEGALQKRVPSWARNASARQIGLFLDSFTEGDGYHKGNGRRILYTSNAGLADDLQEMVLKTGVPSVVKRRAIEGQQKDFGTHVATSSCDGYVVSRAAQPSQIKHHPQNAEIIDYDGHVYCANVPPDHLLFTRRNGYTMWSGNCGIPKELWIAAGALITNEHSRILAIGNPDDPASHFASVCREDSGWAVVQIGAFDSPNFTEEEVPEDLSALLVSPTWVEDMKKDVGEGSGPWISKVLGDFPQDASWQVVSSSGLAKCRALDQPIGLDETVELGMDVGAGGDTTVVIERVGRRMGRVWRESTPRPEQAVALALLALRESGATSIRVDAIGVGWGVAGRLEELRGVEHNAHVHKINVSHAAKDKKRFPKLRDELWWKARTMTENGEWDLSLADDKLIAQLSAPIYGTDPQGRIKIEPKAETKKRLGRSPDDADALLLAFCSPNGLGSVWADAWTTLGKSKGQASLADPPGTLRFQAPPA